MQLLEEAERQLLQPRTWLVTGAAGFIGSHLVEHLIALGQEVVGFDNYQTGFRENVAQALAAAGPDAARNFRMIEGDVRDPAECSRACAGIDVVLHQAGLGSVPRSIEDPVSSHQVNVDGTLNLLVAARDAGVGRFVYASSSSVYGDQPGRTKVEARLGNPCSPYALTKRIDELYARSFSELYGLEVIGLRYFNVFGPRQDPEGPYAAVIPRWIAGLLAHQECVIFGDGKTSRDFCYVENVVQANLLAGLAPHKGPAVNQVYNVGVGHSTSLTRLFELIRDRLARSDPAIDGVTATHRPFRAGDILHSLANISKARELLGYAPTHSVAAGLDLTAEWHLARSSRGQAPLPPEQRLAPAMNGAPRV